MVFKPPTIEAIQHSWMHFFKKIIFLVVLAGEKSLMLKKKLDFLDVICNFYDFLKVTHL